MALPPRLPLLPRDAELLSPELALAREDGRVILFNAGGPVLSFEEGDAEARRLAAAIVSQPAVNLAPPKAERAQELLDEGKSNRAVARALEVSEGAVRLALKQGRLKRSQPTTKSTDRVTPFLGGGVRRVSHPSYQAWSYAELLRGFNEAVHEGEIRLHPCAFLVVMERALHLARTTPARVPERDRRSKRRSRARGTLKPTPSVH